MKGKKLSLLCCLQQVLQVFFSSFLLCCNHRAWQRRKGKKFLKRHKGERKSTVQLTSYRDWF